MTDASDHEPIDAGDAQQDAGPPIASLSYEAARDELVQVVARIESGKASLEESMTLWERGERLATHCQTKLDQAQATLDAAGERELPRGPGTIEQATRADDSQHEDAQDE